MKDFLLSTLFLFFGCLTFGQQAEQVYSIVKIQKDYTYYNEQAGLWEEEVKKSNTDANAWFNYYTAARMSNMFAKENDNRYDIDAIVKSLKKNIPNTFEYHYVSFARSNRSPEGYQHLEKAHAIDPERFEPYDSFITRALLEDDAETMKTFFKKWYQHELYSPGISSWNYNVLIGLDPNAVILTFGDNDTYPLWFLQTIKNIRTDVNVINTSLLLNPVYQEKKFKDLGIPPFEKTLDDLGYPNYRDAVMEHILEHTNRATYIGISAPRDFRTKHDDNLFIVGLAFKYSKHDFDNVAIIRKNYERLFLKDYLTIDLSNDFSQSVVDYMNQQYIPCLTVLYKHYRLSGETAKADEVKALLMHLGKKSNREESLATFFKNFDH